MTPVKIIALAFVLFALIKLVVIFTNPMSWKKIVKVFYLKPLVTTIGSLIVGVIILLCLLKEMTIVQIFASMTFMMALMMVQFSAFGDEIVELSDKYFNDISLIKKAWLSISIWIILMIWVAYEILF